MITVLLLGGALWALGALLRVPVRGRLAVLGALWLAVVLAQLVLPEGAALRQATGGRAEPWLVLAGIVALGLAYRTALRRLRARAAPAGARPVVGGAFSGAELNRYARHILLREVGGAGQKRLKSAKVLVVGAGGLGSPAILYLAASGVGTIGVIDGDVVEESNLQRQIIHADDRIGSPKVQSALIAVKALNPFVEVRPYQRRLDAGIARDLIADYDLVLDGSDNFDTRYLVNEACVALGKPLISAAMTQWEGQIGLYHPAAGGPCYACVFPERPAPGLVPACAEAGVIAPLPGVVGSMMALEAVKWLTGAGEGLAGRLMIYDGLYGEARIITARRRPACAVCDGAQPLA
jgi:molybdopterin/thiamine biosynthesis adenylyltransferase